MKRHLLILLAFVGISLGLPAEYKLLKKFREEKDIGTGLFLSDNYPDAVFIHELRVELASLLLEKGERELAKKVAKGIDLSEVRDSYGGMVVRVWKELGLEEKALVMRFPELATDLLERVELSKDEREKVLSRLLRKKRYRTLLSLKNIPCYYRVAVLFRTGKIDEAVREGKGCGDKRVKSILFLSFLKRGRFEEAQRLAGEDSSIAYRLARHLVGEGDLKRAKKLLLLYEGSHRGLFLAGVISFAQGRFRSAYELFSESLSLARNSRDRAKIHFWIFKSLAQLGYSALAEHHLMLASEGEGFYSLIAKSLLGEPIELPPKVSLKEESAGELVKRLAQIAGAGFLHYMRKEALEKAELLREEDIAFLSRIDPYMAIKIGVRRLPEDSPLRYSLSYPTPFREMVDKASRKTGIDPALIYAVMKQESLFDPLAVSRSGAIGLMQLLESTARWKAEKTGFGLRDVFDPEENIYLGTAYLRYLLDMWKGNLVKTIASYNAGQGRVAKWKDYEDRFLFIEMIPYEETRNYVKKVLRNYYIYSLMLRLAYPQDTQRVSFPQSHR